MAVHTERLVDTKAPRGERYSAPQSPPSSEVRRRDAYAPPRAAEATVWTADPDLQAAGAGVAAAWRAEGARGVGGAGSAAVLAPSGGGGEQCRGGPRVRVG